MRMIDADALNEILDKIPARSIETADGRAYVLIRLSTVFEVTKQMPTIEPERENGYRDGYKRGKRAGYKKARNAGRKKGKWTSYNSCPFCGFQPWYERDIHTLSYCPNCGADMREEGGE